MAKKVDKRDDSHQLTPKQRAFVENYLILGNGTKAAKQAGYAHPATEASKMLKVPKILQALKDRRKEAFKNTELTAELLASELLDMITARPLIKDSDKRKAIELAGKYIGMWDGSGSATSGSDRGLGLDKVRAIVSRITK